MNRRLLIPLIAIAIVLLVPAGMLGDGTEELSFIDSNWLPGNSVACYGPTCMLCQYNITPQGNAPVTCGQADIPAFCGCNISYTFENPTGSCDPFGTCYYHP